jgi:hypothetical protein
MPYYHVLLRLHDEPSVRCVFADLSKKELQRRFVAPYRRGKDLLCGNEIVAVSRIKTVDIIRTADTSATELTRIQEKSRAENEQLNRSSSGFVILDLGRGYQMADISEAGEPVTSEFIHHPPGRGDWWTVAVTVLTHGWGLISVIGTTLIAAALVWWFGFK